MTRVMRRFMNCHYLILSIGTTTKVLVVHSLIPTAEKGKDHDFGVSDDSGDAALYELPLLHSLPK